MCLLNIYQDGRTALSHQPQTTTTGAHLLGCRQLYFRAKKRSVIVFPGERARMGLAIVLAGEGGGAAIVIPVREGGR